MVRKCRRIAEIAVAEMAQVSVRTRARGLALAAAATAAAAAVTATATSSRTEKKRKVRNRELDISKSHHAEAEARRRSSRTRRRVAIAPEDSILPSPEVNSGRLAAALEARCSSRGSDHASASCCSSNGSSERIEPADLKEESVEVETSMNYGCREREETTASSELQAESSEELDSTARMSEANSRGRSTAATAAEKMPTAAELEEFFAEAEKNLQKQFADKYNYDITKDEPLEGRYEWVRLKP